MLDHIRRTSFIFFLVSLCRLIAHVRLKAVRLCSSERHSLRVKREREREATAESYSEADKVTARSFIYNPAISHREELQETKEGSHDWGFLG